jgi:xanthine dehydrogenase YagT iron-sulfur-binding subunit
MKMQGEISGQLLEAGKKDIVLNVNGIDRKLRVDSRVTLAEALREHFGLTGTKLGCNRAECGTCTVIADGRAVYSCTMLAVEAQGRKIETIEGLSSGSELHPLQKLFLDDDALQCGYCTPGIIMSLKALLDKQKKANQVDIRNAISGNYCRCGAYPNIERAVLEYQRVNGK